jgi:hypothetical protein
LSELANMSLYLKTCDHLEIWKDKRDGLGKCRKMLCC